MILYYIICTIFTSLSLSLSLSLSHVLHRLFSPPNKVGPAERTSNSGGPPAEQWRMQCVPLTCGACLERQGMWQMEIWSLGGPKGKSTGNHGFSPSNFFGFEDVMYFQSSHEFALQQSNMECWEIPPFSLMMFPAHSLSLSLSLSRVRGVRSSPCLSTPKNSQSQSHVYGGFLKNGIPKTMGFKTSMVWFWMIRGTPTLGSYLAATAMPVPSQSNFFGESPHGLGTPGSCWAVASCHAVLGGGTTGPTNGEKWGHKKLSSSWMMSRFYPKHPETISSHWLRTEACSIWGSWGSLPYGCIAITR